MALRDLQRLFRYWDRVPPVHELAAAYLRVKDPGPSTRVKSAPFSPDEIARLAELNSRIFGLGPARV